MRNLKKILALVLALMMTLSLMVTASAADFVDQDDIKYTEAVDVMTAIGVLNGVGDGKFNPGGILTRAEAAKITAYILLTQPTADKLGNNIATYFDDVPSGEWYSGPIGYVANAGIVNGDGQGKFNPFSKLTGYAFGKMMLLAAGIGEAADYEGANWTMGVALALNKSGLDAGLEDVVLSNDMTREQAAQMAFNALNYNPDGKTTTYTVKNQEGASKADSDPVILPATSDVVTAYLVASTADEYYIVNDTVSVGSLGYNLYGLKRTNTGTDDFGRPIVKWTSTKNPKLKVELTSGALLTYDAPVSPSQIFNALGLPATKTGVAYSVDGVDKAPVDLDRADTEKDIGHVGATTQVFKNEDGIYSIVEVTNYLAKVTKVNAAKAATATAPAADANVVVEVYGLADDLSTVSALTWKTDAYARGEYVVVTVKKGTDADSGDPTYAIASMEPATPVEGVMTAYTAGTITVEGNVLAIADKNNTTVPGTVGFTNTWTHYTKDGVVLGSVQKTAGISTDYVYVISEQGLKATGTLYGDGGLGARAEVIFAADGSHSVIELALGGTAAAPTYSKPDSDGTVNATATLTQNDEATPVGNWFAYTVNSDGEYILKPLSATYAKSISPDTWTVTTTNDTNGLVLTVGTPKDITIGSGTKYTTSSTSIVTVDSKYNRSEVTGLIAAKLSGNVLVTYAKDSNVISAIYAVGQAAPAQTSNYAYAVKQGNTTATGAVWTFSINGSQVDYVISGGDAVAAGKVYTLTSAANGTYTAASAGIDTTNSNAANIAKEVVTVVDPAFFVTNAETYTYAITGCAVYDVSNDATVKGEAATLEEGACVIVVDDTNHAASVIYIVNAPSANGAELGDLTGADLVEGVNNTATLTDPTYTANSSNLTVSSATWASSNTSVATINASTGVVTLAASGTTTITYTATLSNGATLTKTCTVTCKGVEGGSVSISKSAPTSTTGTDGSATATFTAGTDSELTATGYAWSVTAGADKASISGTGATVTITGLDAGDATIQCIVTLSNGAKITETATVTIP